MIKCLRCPTQVPEGPAHNQHSALWWNLPVRHPWTEQRIYSQPGGVLQGGGWGWGVRGVGAGQGRAEFQGLGAWLHSILFLPGQATTTAGPPRYQRAPHASPHPAADAPQEDFSRTAAEGPLLGHPKTKQLHSDKIPTKFLKVPTLPKRKGPSFSVGHLLVTWEKEERSQVLILKQQRYMPEA